MKWRYVVVAVLVAAAGLTSLAAAAPTASKQRVSMSAKGVNDGTFVGKFVFTPRESGTLRSDSGKQTCKNGPERATMREGQEVSIYEPTICTWTGKRGTFVTRSRNDWVDAGNGYYVNTGTWKLLRGTGQYDAVSGGGRNAGAWVDRGPGPWTGNAEGYLTSS